MGGTRRGTGPVTHRDTGEQRRIRAVLAQQEAQDRAAEEPRYQAPRRPSDSLLLPSPEVLQFSPERDAVRRLSLWLGIFVQILAILSLLLLLYFGGSALVHGGWPIWFLTG